MNKYMLLIALIAVIVLSVSCSPFEATAGVAQVKTPTPTPAPVIDKATADRITDLENRVKRLEQGLDPRVIEYNMVQSALWKILLENGFDGMMASSLPYTNDMRQFPNATIPLYGFDKNKDGKPDTNYVPFEKTLWFYQANVNSLQMMVQGPDPKLVEILDGGKGRAEAFETELHNVQTAVMAMLADSKAGVLDGAKTNVNDMDLLMVSL